MCGKTEWEIKMMCVVRYACERVSNFDGHNFQPNVQNAGLLVCIEYASPYVLRYTIKTLRHRPNERIQYGKLYLSI